MAFVCVIMFNKPSFLPDFEELAPLFCVELMLNKNTWGVKNVGPIRSNIANRQARPKGLISAEVKKLLYQIVVIP